MGKNKKVTFTDADEPYLLKIDMDWIPPREYIKEFISLAKIYFAKQHIEVKKYIQYISYSRMGVHFIFKTDTKLTDDQRCKIQFLLGDDRKRCRMNWQSIQLGMSDWNKLYIDNRYKKIV